MERGGIAAAWAGGWKGRKVIDKLIPLLPELLSPSGEMLMVTVPDNDPQGTFKKEKKALCKTFLAFFSFVSTCFPSSLELRNSMVLPFFCC